MPFAKPEGNYYLGSPEGIFLHIPNEEGDKPICRLSSSRGWFEIEDSWGNLIPICKRCRAKELKNARRVS